MASRSATSPRDGHPAEGAYTLAPFVYVDPAVWESERSSIFSKEWIPVARANDLPNKGDYVAADIAGEPIVVVRDAAGGINALSNVCRHRSMVMLEGSGNAPRIMCPYHLWAYKFDGALLGAPHMEGSASFKKDACALPRFACEEWMGWVFVNLDPSASALQPGLAELAAKLPPDLAEWRTTSVAHFASPFNWKIIVENGTESYHNIGSHTQSIQSYWPGGQSRPVATAADYAEVRHPNDPAMGTFTAYTVFPAMTFTHQEPDDSILWYDLQIHGRSACDMYLRVLMPPHRARDADAVERMHQVVSLIHQEDIAACAKVQRGVGSRFATPGPLSELEAPLRHFHAWLAARLP